MVRSTVTGWWLGLLLAGAAPAVAQTQGRPADPPRVELKENTPNPIVTATTIPFVIHPEVCAQGHRPLVTLKVYNVLVQVVATPTLRADSAVALEQLRLRCGEHRAWWDGRLADGRDATTGVYYYQLVVDGETYTRKMTIQRRVTSRK